MRIARFALPLLCAVIYVPVIAQDSGSAISPPRLIKVGGRAGTEGYLIDHIFGSDPTASAAVFELKCTRQRNNADVGSGPITPNRVPSTSGTTLTYKVVNSDLTDVDALDCTLFDRSAAGGGAALVATRFDLSDRLERIRLQDDVTRNAAELDRCRSGGGTTPTAPVWREPVLLPDRAKLRFETSGCAQIKARVWNDAGYDQTSDTTRLGTTHEVPFRPLPSGAYNVQAWVVNPLTGARVPNTLMSQTDAFRARERVDDVAFTQIEPRLIESGIKLAIRTNVPALVGVEVREYDVKTGVPGKIVTPEVSFSRDEHGMPRDVKDTSFSIPIKLRVGGTYQYRLKAVNANNKEHQTRWEERPVITVAPAFGLASALEVAVTPVGIILGWKATDKPDEVSLAIKDVTAVTTTTIVPTTSNITIGLTADATAAYLQRVNRGEAPTLIATMKRAVETDVGVETRIVTHELLVKLTTTPDQAREIVANASFMTADDKDKLLQVATNAVAGRGRPRFNWQQVFQNAVQLLIRAVVP
jgi:hypothetical protein